ncbi:MAG: hypothetical protein DSM106950_05830 [Stigonema ocellatum SAG 48.90 = DSM 106950]|nr:hypothetical protein [Stigonema ocellatum SAG 48.90 = DSM 106950]
MGINSAKLFCATLTVATILSGIALTSPVKAQSQSTSTPEATSAPSAPASGAPGSVIKPSRSTITPEQRQKIDALRKEMYDEIQQSVLNKDQQTQYTQAISSGKTPPQALRGLSTKLTPDQNSKIKSIRTSYQAKAREIRNPQSSSQPAPGSTLPK